MAKQATFYVCGGCDQPIVGDLVLLRGQIEIANPSGRERRDAGVRHNEPVIIDGGADATAYHRRCLCNKLTAPLDE